MHLVRAVVEASEAEVPLRLPYELGVVVNANRILTYAYKVSKSGVGRS